MPCKLNMARRHLTNAQKDAITRQQVADTPEKTNRQMARDLGVSHTHVANVRREEMEKSSDVATVATSINTLGREQIP